MQFQFSGKPEKQDLVFWNAKLKLLHVAVSAFHTPPRDSPENVIMTHLAIFVAPLAFSSQQPHPRTSSAAGQAYQAGSQPHIPHTRSHKSTHRAACTRSSDWKSMGRDDKYQLSSSSSHHRVFSGIFIDLQYFLHVPTTIDAENNAQNPWYI